MQTRSSATLPHTRWRIPGQNIMQSIARDAIGTIVSVSADSNGSEKDLSFLILGYDMIVND